MENLAGKTRADLHILKELETAGIEIVEGKKTRSEVPYTLTGKLADWNFSRAWYYWVANAQDGGGLPLEIATELHERKYPTSSEMEPKKYGDVVRVAGHCGCPHPNGWAKNYDSQGLRLIIDPEGKQEAEYNLLREKFPDMNVNPSKYRFVPTLEGLVVKSVIDSYHVDSQEGLNALAGTIRNLHKMASNGTDPKEIKRLHDKISSLYVEWTVDAKHDGIEWLKKLPIIDYGDRTVIELLVGIRHGMEVVSIAKKWKDNKIGSGGIAQHFFEGGQITGFNYGHISGPGQILNRGPEIDEKLRPHYEELKAIRPKTAPSLELCIQRLETPGPQYQRRKVK